MLGDFLLHYMCHHLRRMNRFLGLDGFVFSDETSDLSDDEYRSACRTLNAMSA